MFELLLDRAGPTSFAGDDAQVPRWPCAVPQARAVSGRPPKVEEIIALMREAGDSPHVRRLRGAIVVVWRAGLRIQQALALAEADLDQCRGSAGPARQRPAPP